MLVYPFLCDCEIRNFVKEGDKIHVKFLFDLYLVNLGCEKEMLFFAFR